METLLGFRIMYSPALRWETFGASKSWRAYRGVRCAYLERDADGRLLEWKAQGIGSSVIPCSICSDKEVRIIVIPKENIPLTEYITGSQSSQPDLPSQTVAKTSRSNGRKQFMPISIDDFLDDILETKPPSTALRTCRRTLDMVHFYAPPPTDFGAIINFVQDKAFSGILPIKRCVDDDEITYVVTDFSLLSLQRAFLYFPEAVFGIRDGTGSTRPSYTRLKYLAYQMLRAVEQLHAFGIPHLGLTPSLMTINRGGSWLLLTPPCLNARFPLYRTVKAPFDSSSAHKSAAISSMSSKWASGGLSNLEYLMLINEAAGRYFGDDKYAPVIPWVTNFVDWGWRDLTKSKFRLKKGDAQLQTTYVNGMPPHHIPENLTDLTYYVYMARKTPKSVLTSVVRSQFRAQEYPNSMAGLYEWSPDECIVEFFTDSNIFKSDHSDMPDLAWPKDVSSSVEFIKVHREMLESDYVSAALHHWIDLNFGYKLSGEAAVDAMNVPLVPLFPELSLVHGPRFVQLFDKPHPRRLALSPPAKQTLMYKTPEKSVSDRSAFKMSDFKMFANEKDELMTPPKAEKHQHTVDWNLLKRSPSIKLPSKAEAVDSTFFGLAYEQQGDQDLSNEYKIGSRGFNCFLDAIYYPPLPPYNQYDDIFALGCIFAQLFMPGFTPIFRRDVLDSYFTEIVGRPLNLKSLVDGFDQLPLPIQHMVEDMVHPLPGVRPSLDELLRNKYLFSVNLPFDELYTFHSKWHTRSNHPNWEERAELASRYFPTFFQNGDLVAEILLQDFLDLVSSNVSVAVEAALSSWELFSRAVGTDVIFPHVLSVVESLLRSLENEESLSNSQCSTSDYENLWDVLCVFTKFRFVYGILGELGPIVLLESYVPLLVDVLHAVDISEQEGISDFSRRKAQVNASESINQLSSPGALGSDISTKYLIPILLERMGQLKPKVTLLPESLLGVARRLGEGPTAKLIIPHLFGLLPVLLKKIPGSEISHNVYMSATEVVHALSLMLSVISRKQTIYRLFIDGGDESGQVDCTLHKFLELLPTPRQNRKRSNRFFLNDHLEGMIDSIENESANLHSLLGKTILDVCHAVGREATLRKIIPSLKNLVLQILKTFPNMESRSAELKVVITFCRSFFLPLSIMIGKKLFSSVFGTRRTQRVEDFYRKVGILVDHEDEDDEPTQTATPLPALKPSSSEDLLVGTNSVILSVAGGLIGSGATIASTSKGGMALELHSLKKSKGKIGISRAERIAREKKEKEDAMEHARVLKLRRDSMTFAEQHVSSSSRRLDLSFREQPKTSRTRKAIQSKHGYSPVTFGTTDFVEHIADGGLVDISSIASNRDESLVLAGTRDGMITSMGIGNGRPLLSHQTSVGTHPIASMHIFDHQALACNGGLHLWDVNTGRFADRIAGDNKANFIAMAAWESSPKRAAVTTNHGAIVCIDFRDRCARVCYEWNVSHEHEYLSCIALEKEHYIAVGSSAGKVYSLDQRTGRVLSSFETKNSIGQLVCVKNLILANEDPNLTVVPGASERLYGIYSGRAAVTSMPVDFKSQKCVFVANSFFNFSQQNHARLIPDRVTAAKFLPLSRLILVGSATGIRAIDVSQGL
jgi:serine/threonine protein kinase